MPVLEIATGVVALSSAASSVVKWFREKPIRERQKVLGETVRTLRKAALGLRSRQQRLTAEWVTYVHWLASPALKARRMLQKDLRAPGAVEMEAEITGLVEEAAQLKVTPYGVFDNSVTVVSVGALGLELLDNIDAVPFLHEHVGDLLTQMGAPNVGDFAGGASLLDLSIGDFLGALGLGWSLFRIGHNVKRMLETEDRLQALDAQQGLLDQAADKMGVLEAEIGRRAHGLEGAAHTLFKLNWMADRRRLRRLKPAARNALLSRLMEAEQRFWAQVRLVRAMES